MLRGPILLLPMAVLLAVGCSDETPTQQQPESLTRPRTPDGPRELIPDEPGTFSTGGATSDMRHPVEYRFVWGNGATSPWSRAREADNSWGAAGTYGVAAQARCTQHPSAMSYSPGSLGVIVGFESVSIPVAPAGTDSVCPDRAASLSTAGATSSLGHSIEYQLDWGDGSLSVWSERDTLNHIWTAGGPYAASARARCAVDTSVVSPWSAPALVSMRDASWVVEYFLVALTGEYHPTRWPTSSDSRVDRVVYDGPKATITKVGHRYGGHGGGAMVRLCDETTPQIPEYLVFDYYIGVEGEGDFFRGEMCAHGYPHGDFVCNPNGNLGNLYSRSHLVSEGDTIRVRFSAWLLPPNEPVCGYTTGPPYARIDSVRMWLLCECEPETD